MVLTPPGAAGMSENPRRNAARPPVGHLVNRAGGPEGQAGTGYDYLMAGNGVFVQARNELLSVRIMLTQASIRGLEPADSRVELAHGQIPSAMLYAGLEWFQQEPDVERYFAIGWDGRSYRPHVPPQEGRPAGMTYEPLEGMVAEFHSHGRMRAFFSNTDDRDEQGFRIYGVMGKLDQETPQVAMRAGIYGHFQSIQARCVFA